MDLFPAETRTFENALRSAPSLYERPATFAESYQASVSHMENFYNFGAYQGHRRDFIEEHLEEYYAAGHPQLPGVPETLRLQRDPLTGQPTRAAQTMIDQVIAQMEAAGVPYPSEGEIHEAAIQRMGEAYAENQQFEQRPQGIGGLAGSLLGMGVGYVNDFVQAGTIAIGGVGGGSLARLAAREFVVNAGVEAGLQTVTFDKKHEAVPEFGIDDAAEEVLTAGLIGAGFGAVGGAVGKVFRRIADTREFKDARQVLEREAEIDRSNPLEPTAAAAAAHRAALERASAQINRSEAPDVEEIVEPYRKESSELSEARAARLAEEDPGLSAQQAKALDNVSGRSLELDELRAERDAIDRISMIEAEDGATGQRLRAIEDELAEKVTKKRRGQLEAERETLLAPFAERDFEPQINDARIGPNKQIKRLEKQLRKAEAELRKLNRKANALLDDLDAAKSPAPPTPRPEPETRAQAPEEPPASPTPAAAARAPARSITPTEAPEAAAPAPQTSQRPSEPPGRSEEGLQAPEEAMAPTAAQAAPAAAADPELVKALDEDVKRILEEREFNVILADDEGGSRTVSAKAMMEEADEEIQQAAEIMTCAVGGAA